MPPSWSPGVSLCVTDTVGISTGSVRLEGNLDLPPEPRGVVLLNHRERSARRRIRLRDLLNEALLKAGFATLLVDLLTEGEEMFLMSRTDEALGGERLLAATHWLATDPRTAALDIGCVGEGAGVPATLLAATRPDSGIRAIVTHGGRPHHAGASLEAVQVPTLMLVGGEDRDGLESGRKAAMKLRGKSQVFVIPGTSHPFAESGAAEELARHSVRWFTEHLAAGGPQRPGIRSEIAAGRQAQTG